MKLCQHRPEGFGPHSRLHSSLPTTCFEDVVLIPLASWVFIVLVAAVLVPRTLKTLKRDRTYAISETRLDSNTVGRFRAGGSFFSSTVARPVQSSDLMTAESNSSKSRGSSSRSRRGLGLACAILYYFLIFAMTAMVSLEIARQTSATIGIGLLPFTYVGVVGAFLAHALIHTKTSRLVGFSFWLLYLVFMSVKVATYSKESDEGYKRAIAVRGVPLDMYKVSDQITDDSTMIGVAAVLAALEMFAFFGLSEK